MRIIVADDEPDMRDYFAKILAHLGHEVLEVTCNGRSLIESCKRTSPELVITDVLMPELNGDEALREIWENQHVPAILVSAYPCPQWLEQASQIPQIRYLNKPINREALQSALQSFDFNPPTTTAGDSK